MSQGGGGGEAGEGWPGEGEECDEEHGVMRRRV